MNSYTSARVYMTVPNALSLNQSELDAYYTGIRNANINWVRIVLPWNAVQPNAPTVTTTTTWFFVIPITTTTITPTFTWTAADLAVNRALAAGLNVQVVLAPPKPSWVLKIDATAVTPVAQALASRYKPGGAGITVPGGSVAEFQFWNEPNVLANWVTSVSAAEYTVALKAFATAVRTNHPAAKVIAAGLQACMTASRPTTPSERGYTSAQEPVAFLKAMYTAGAKGYFDVAVYHPLCLPTAQFTEPPAPSGVTMRAADAFWAALKAKEPTKKVYWGQVGFHTPTVSTVQQAAYLDTMRWFAEERSSWVTGLMLPQWRDY